MAMRSGAGLDSGAADSSSPVRFELFQDLFADFIG